MNSDLSENLENITDPTIIKINRNNNKSPHRKTSNSPKRDMTLDILPIFTDKLILEDTVEISNKNNELKSLINSEDNKGENVLNNEENVLNNEENVLNNEENVLNNEENVLNNEENVLNNEENVLTNEENVLTNENNDKENPDLNNNETSGEESKFTINNIVFSGGGIKGFAFLGALKYLYENDYNKDFLTFAGTSIGSIFALVLSLGYTFDEIFHIFTKINLEEINDITSDNILNFFDLYGVDNGSKVERIIEIIIKAKTNEAKINFLDLYTKTQKHLIVNATNLNEKKNEVFDYINTPKFTVSKALRMSISIPFFYTPVKYDNKLYIDGGCVNNFIIDLFKNKSKNTIGFLLRNKDIIESKDEDISNYFSNVLNCLMDYDRILDKNHYNIVEIYTDIHFLKLDINEEEKNNLIKIGYEETKNFFEDEIKL